MKIRNLELYDRLLEKGRKKVTRTVATGLIIATLLTPTTAFASVPNNVIIGDLQTTEDRSLIKQNDAQYIDDYFAYESDNVSLERVQMAIELAETMNSYLAFDVNYINTTKNEITSLDLERLHKEMKYYKDTNNKRELINFSIRNQWYLPALNAYALFGSKTVKGALCNEMSKRVVDITKENTKSARALTDAIIEGEEVYVIIENGGRVEKILLKGPYIDELVGICNQLDYHYNTAINSISGASPYYENTFAYNGINVETRESVWLSMTDVERDDTIECAMGFCKDFQDKKELITTGSPETMRKLTYYERQKLQQMLPSVPKYKINNGVSYTITFEKAVKLTK